MSGLVCPCSSQSFGTPNGIAYRRLFILRRQTARYQLKKMELESKLRQNLAAELKNSGWQIEICMPQIRIFSQYESRDPDSLNGQSGSQKFWKTQASQKSNLVTRNSAWRRESLITVNDILDISKIEAGQWLTKKYHFAWSLNSKNSWQSAIKAAGRSHFGDRFPQFYSNGDPVRISHSTSPGIQWMAETGLLW